MHVTSTKPYLIRGIYDWALDQGLTPQIIFSTEHDEVVVPVEHMQDGQILLNIHPQAVKHLELGNEYIMFSARFSGHAREVTVPVDAVLAIFARENGQGLGFTEASGAWPAGAVESAEKTLNESYVEGQEPPPPVKDDGAGRPNLKLVE